MAQSNRAVAGIFLAAVRTNDLTNIISKVSIAQNFMQFNVTHLTNSKKASAWCVQAGRRWEASQATVPGKNDEILH